MCAKNFEYENFRVDNHLQRSQKLTYILVIGLAWNVSQNSVFARLKTLFIWPLIEFLSFKTSKLKCRQLGKLCPSNRCTTFVLADFDVFKRNLKNASKVLEKVQRH
jgi:hypothetical protein